MQITSKRSGMTVTMSDEDYGALLAQYGEHGAYEHILNTAGNVLSHRTTLAKIREQILTDEQRTMVRSLARATMVQDAIDAEISDMGYSSYLTRRDQGGMMPESWGRICARARSKIDVSAIGEPDDSYLNHAMYSLGLYTDDDQRWSERRSAWCNWEITAPAGWGEPKTVA